MNCRDVMTQNPSCCFETDTAVKAAQIMRNENVGSVPIVSGHDNELCGIITDRDLCLKVLAEGRDPGAIRLQEIMTSDPVCCRPDDDLDDCMNLMSRYQVRRIPVIDDSWRLVGIIAQADIARHVAQREEVAEVVEDISEPAGIGPRSFRPRRGLAGGAAGSGMLLLGGLAVGAGLMYFLDPNRGRRRRAVVRDKAVRLYHASGDFVDKAREDMVNRASGLVAEARNIVRQEHVPDHKLTERIRSRIGRVVSHPHAIQVISSRGYVRLAGPILAHEVRRLMSVVRSTPGVVAVENNLEMHPSAEGVSGLQGGRERSGQRWEFAQENWTPAARLLAAALGGFLASYGMKKHNAVGTAAAALGAGLVTRGITNRELLPLDVHPIESAQRILMGRRGIA
ncbi:MAG: CBS domain-containing protein [Acidobacteria bacterium]|nr:CBS domain-containing protein [Acidobacteriota bacterium]MBI3278778.1 CBS domain-containing protein [Acidobacteriota bacterium]